MAVTQYIGARYVPLFADPLEWSNANTYEPLTIVYYQGNSYTSRQSVPVGIDITNTDYWALTGNYNAQIEAYRKEVQQYDQRITNAQNTADTAKENSETAKNSAANAQSTASNAQTTANSKAPINHASNDTTYGIGNSTQYGHVKITDTIESVPDMASDGIAASPTAVKTEVDAAKNDLSTDINNIYSKKTHIIVIGDSFSDESLYDYVWPTKLPSQYTVHNYAEQGAGFLDSGTISNEPFSKQLTDAINDKNYNHDLVKAIIIYGGYNDFIHGRNASDTATAISSLCNNALTNFKGANIICVIGNNGFCARSEIANYREWISDVLRQTTNMPKPCVNAYYWLYGFGPTTVFNTDKLHPTSNGHYFIAQYMNELINGCFEPSSKWMFTGPILSEGSEATEQDGKVYAMFNPAGEFKLSGQYNIPANNVGDNYVEISAIADSRFMKFPGNNCLTFPYFINSYMGIGCYLSPSDGKLHIQVSQSGADKSVYF